MFYLNRKKKDILLIVLHLQLEINTLRNRIIDKVSDTGDLDKYKIY